jgi:hypothetical protein
MEIYEPDAIPSCAVRADRLGQASLTTEVHVRKPSPPLRTQGPGAQAPRRL